MGPATSSVQLRATRKHLRLQLPVRMYEIVGAAVPVTTPISYAVANSLHRHTTLMSSPDSFNSKGPCIPAWAFCFFPADYLVFARYSATWLACSASVAEKLCCSVRVGDEV